MSSSKFITGVHDPGGEHLLGGRGWIVFTEMVDSQPGDYRRYVDQGLGVIVRLNNGYHPAGTIPTPDRYAEFAQKCAAWVAASQGVEWLTIGNEISLEWEWPTEKPITLASYLDCYRQVYTAIKAVAPHVKIAPQAVAPWNASTPDAPDWISQLRVMLLALDNKVDWINLHAYTRGYGLDRFTSGERMNPPWQTHYSGWETLYQFMHVIPDHMHHLPVMVTEVNGNAPWSQYQRGWVQAMYNEIAEWNAEPGAQQIRAACLFRWAPHDSQWDMSQCSQAHDDLRSAVAKGYQWRDARPQVLPAPQWTGFVTATNGLNLRTEPHATANVLTTIAMGERVAISEQRGDWLAATYGALSGWVSARWVSEQKPAINGGSTVDERSAIIAKLAAEYGVDERLAKAVIKIESGGSGFRNGRLIMRFEPHVFKTQLKELFEQHFEIGNPAWDGEQHQMRFAGGDWGGFHGDQDKEYEALDLAQLLAKEAALRSASYGAGQILGINYASVGYRSAEEMKVAFEKSEEAQIRAMFEYMRNRGLIQKLKDGDLLGFASAYNGPGQAQHYANLIREAMGK